MDPPSILMETKGHLMLKKSHPINEALTLYNVCKCCEFHKQNRCTTAECIEPKKALRELANKGQIGRFLKRGHGAFRKGPIQSHRELWEKECSNEVLAPIAGGYTEGVFHTI